ncbi:hypothetical protein JCM19231_1924 [Vibrio ishigakensis]|uniref:Aspartate racemase n=1 Tax=Vibrio ishigakensis TaxID=1481914 RepID=A0A0B8NVG0_9VIBR|nr:hypothetical protein JCM19231_1924 [Vibrio ishigakensis]
MHSAIYGEVTGQKTECGQDIRHKNGIKSGEFERNAGLLALAIQPLVERGATTIILGCTELPLVRSYLQKQFPQLSFIDPMEAVADRVVAIYQRAEILIEAGYFPKVGLEPTQIHEDQDIIDYILSNTSY